MDKGPGPGRALLAAGLFLAFAGSAWYIAYLRAQNTQLRAQHGQSKPAAALPAAPAAKPKMDAGPDRTLSDTQREAMLTKLRETTSSERPVWFATWADNPESASFRMALQAVFEEAGWEVKGNEQVKFQLKPGLYMMAADEEPPQYILDVGDALEAAGITATIGRGYREFYEEKKKENPNWNGVTLLPEQTYVLVIGPKPPS
jgi:hypothetical protein